MGEEITNGKARRSKSTKTRDTEETGNQNGNGNMEIENSDSLAERTSIVGEEDLNSLREFTNNFFNRISELWDVETILAILLAVQQKLHHNEEVKNMVLKTLICHML